MKSYTIVGVDLGELYHHVLPDLKKTGAEVVAIVASKDGWAVSLAEGVDVPRLINWAVAAVVEQGPMVFTLDDIRNLLVPWLPDQETEVTRHED